MDVYNKLHFLYHFIFPIQTNLKGEKILKLSLFAIKYILSYNQQPESAGPRVMNLDRLTFD